MIKTSKNNKFANINVRLYPEIKEEAERIFEYHGLSIAEVVTVFLNHPCHVGGFPFDLKAAPYTDDVSVAAFAEAESIKNNSNSKGFRSVAELVADLDNDND
ncbi:MAG: type II toxin-antitoxin system RelB/DinJ family antitoxin [Bacteroidetes bacterium]|nr:type II toxin-antitoxin system RelB/DinJ family antitoxin [Bacteroidota bacterium]